MYKYNLIKPTFLEIRHTPTLLHFGINIDIFSTRCGGRKVLGITCSTRSVALANFTKLIRLLSPLIFDFVLGGCRLRPLRLEYFRDECRFFLSYTLCLQLMKVY